MKYCVRCRIEFNNSDYYCKNCNECMDYATKQFCPDCKSVQYTNCCCCGCGNCHTCGHRFVCNQLLPSDIQQLSLPITIITDNASARS